MTIAPLRRYVLSGMAVATLAGCGSSLLRQPGVAPGEVTARKATTAQQTRRNLKYAVLYNFKSGASDSAVRRTGAEPYATLINVNGTLYGTTVGGGDKTNDGTVFSITKSGTEAVVYRFKGYTGAAVSDGSQPEAALLDVKGTLYGNTRFGGSRTTIGSDSGECGPSGCGTVFSIAPSGRERVLHSFTGSLGEDGSNPEAALIDVNGTLYGTTETGGKYEYGEVFSLAP
jgi:uncharacterized repeat protein (TIGR03803 family)